MKRSGFTMVELMLVILIIGILATGMFLATSGGQDNAQATIILSDLRVMKSGAYMLTIDSPDFQPAMGVNYAEFLSRYMDHGRIRANYDRYAFFVDYSNSQWWIGIELTENGRVREILEGKAMQTDKFALYGSDDLNTPPPDFALTYAYKKANTTVWCKAK